MDYLLSILVFLPLVGALVLAVLPRGREGLIKGGAVALGAIEFLLSLQLYFGFDSAAPGMQFVERYAWIPAFGIHFHLGIDGLSLFLVLLTTLLTPLVLLSAWIAVAPRAKEFAVAVLALTAAMVGAFTALDLFLFYVFSEAALLPIFLLIGVWGYRRRVYAAVKFLLYSLTGSLLLLVAMIYLAEYRRGLVGAPHLGLPELGQLALPLEVQQWLFLAFFASFAIKMSLFPLHTWLSDTQAEAPTAAAVLLLGAWLKIGAYGLLRFCLPLFPEAFHYFVDYLMALAVAGILYGALLAAAQTELKRVVAGASVSQMGLVVLGICTLNTQGVQGSIVQMIHHSLSAGALVLVAGMLDERFHPRDLAQFGGLARTMPMLAGFFLIATLAAVGLPGLSGFVGEFLILLGSFKAFHIGAVLALLGVVLLGVCLLGMWQRIAWGEAKCAVEQKRPDLGWRELVVLLPLLLLALWIGVYPEPFFDRIEGAVEQVLVRAGVEDATDFPSVEDVPGDAGGVWLSPLDGEQ